MGLNILFNIVHSGHRDIKVSGDGLVALRLSMLSYDRLSHLLRQFSVVFFLFFMLSVLHTGTSTLLYVN